MKKGVKVALSTNFPEVSWEALQVQVGECLREGVPYATVIDSLTKVPAQILGLDEEAGCLEAGRWADLSVWSAEYGSFNNRCIKTMVRGEWAQKGAGK